MPEGNKKSIAVPPDLHREVKIQSSADGVGIEEWAAEALRAKLDIKSVQGAPPVRPLNDKIGANAVPDQILAIAEEHVSKAASAIRRAREMVGGGGGQLAKDAGHGAPHEIRRKRRKAG